MKLKKTVILTIIMALSVLPVLGCKAEPEVEANPARSACIEMMQKVPVYYDGFEFWDAKVLRSDPDLGEMYQIWYERKADSLEQRFGITSTSIDYLAQGEGLLDIIKADYDISKLRDRISLDFYRDTDHADIEVWKSRPSHDPQSVTGGWVLAEGYLVRGANNSNVDDYLRVATGEEISMYDRNAAALLKELPEGMLTRINRSPYPEGLIVSGDSMEKVEGSTLRWTNVYKFQSSEAASSNEADEYFSKIEDDFNIARNQLTSRGETPPFSEFTLEHNGEFVKWSMLIEVKYMIAMLFYG